MPWSEDEAKTMSKEENPTIIIAKKMQLPSKGK